MGGRFTGRCETLVKELDIEDMIVWSGFRQDIP
jgi:hypothetical protein